MNHNTQREIVKSDITPPRKMRYERIALRNARRRILELLRTKHVLSTMFILEYSLADHNSERDLEKQMKNEKNP